MAKDSDYEYMRTMSGGEDIKMLRVLSGAVQLGQKVYAGDGVIYRIVAVSDKECVGERVCAESELPDEEFYKLPDAVVEVRR